ncbi:unnamed protein product [Rhizoctonia solani]|uniref:C2H2-type domain-containing protein n=1 Tax=Rhizoctonia solani TaxID=456999 RepID=A0A8H3EAD8_9AGAM|nr:unnamed protein product [Rhizoctonia solani]
MDVLRDALRPLTCKWAGCSAMLVSWKHLYQHYKKVHLSPSRLHNVYECHIKENQRGRLCNTGFETYDGLWGHLKINHLNKLLYQCPFAACNMNLKRLESDDDIQEHFDQHNQFGEEITLANRRELSTAHLSPLPQENLTYRLVTHFFTCPNSSPGAILQARKRVISNSYEHESHLFGPLLTDEWLEEEETSRPASSKERRIRLSGPIGSQQPSREVPKLQTPFLPLSPHPPRHLVASVGFNSPGFHQKAQFAFQKVEEDIDMDSD